MIEVPSDACGKHDKCVYGQIVCKLTCFEKNDLVILMKFLMEDM